MSHTTVQIKQAMQEAVQAINDYTLDLTGATLKLDKQPRFVYHPRAGWYVVIASAEGRVHLGANVAEAVEYYHKLRDRYRHKKERRTMPRQPEISVEDSDRDLMTFPSQARPTNPTPEEDK